MTRRPSVLCPIDFSDASRAALRYAVAIADHFGATLTLLTVDDPLLAEAAASTGQVSSLEDESREELTRFASEALSSLPKGARSLDSRVAVGKPAPEILRIANELPADIIVMSSQGRSGVRKMFFGSTTERVLRETHVPVLVTPDDRERALSLSEIGRQIHRALAPVDLTPASRAQVKVAAAVASAISVPLLLAHVIEPVFLPARVRQVAPGTDALRRDEVAEQLAQLAAAAAPGVNVETLILTGDPSEEIVKLASTRNVGLIVMGLHSSGLLGPRMGTVTYRVLSLGHALVLALPPTAP